MYVHMYAHKLYMHALLFYEYMYACIIHVHMYGIVTCMYIFTENITMSSGKKGAGGITIICGL